MTTTPPSNEKVACFLPDINHHHNVIKRAEAEYRAALPCGVALFLQRRDHVGGSKCGNKDRIIGISLPKCCCSLMIALPAASSNGGTS